MQQLVCKYLLIIVSLLLAKCSTSVIVKKGRVKETKSAVASSLAPTIAPETPYDRGIFLSETPYDKTGVFSFFKGCFSFLAAPFAKVSPVVLSPNNHTGSPLLSKSAFASPLSL